MSRFTKFTDFHPLPDGKSWVVMKDFGYEIGKEGSGDVINTPVGFVTDFASVPKLLQNIFSVWGKHGNAAVIHDWLYWEQPYWLDRKKCDDIFYEAMGILGVSYFTKHALYWAVRYFGWMAWNNNKKNKENGVCRIMDISNLV